jgi:hypothetical protein
MSTIPTQIHHPRESLNALPDLGSLSDTQTVRPNFVCITAANQGGGLFGGGANNQAAQAIAQGRFGGGINQGQAGTWAVEVKRRLSLKSMTSFDRILHA